MKIRKAVIPAAGLGTRVLPATMAMPKEMLAIVDKPAIQYIVEEAVRSGRDTLAELAEYFQLPQTFVEKAVAYSLGPKGLQFQGK